MKRAKQQGNQDAESGAGNALAPAGAIAGTNAGAIARTNSGAAMGYNNAGAGAVGMQGGTGVQGGHASGTARGAGYPNIHGTVNPAVNPRVNQPSNPSANPRNPAPVNQTLMQNTPAPATILTAPLVPTQPISEASGQNNPPVPFKTIARRNQVAGQQDETLRASLCHRKRRGRSSSCSRSPQSPRTLM
jgi:hypothetical protein